MEFRLLMLSAMYENGGNTVHRFLDGHPEMYVYPFESQLGIPICAGPSYLNVSGKVSLAGV